MSTTVGAEIKKARPAVIVSQDAVGILPLRVIVPIIEWKERYAQAAWIVALTLSSQNGLKKHLAADAFQIRSISKERFVRQLGLLEEEVLADILDATQTVISEVKREEIVLMDVARPNALSEKGGYNKKRFRIVI